MSIPPEKLISWLALKQVRGIGNTLFRRLVERFGSPDAVFQAPREALLTTKGISPTLADAVKSFRIPPSIEKEIIRTHENGFHIITQNHTDYPRLLIQIPDPPPYLYVYGKIDPDSANIAVVGSRNATGYGLKMARRIASQLAAAGITVVSGMARGIDTAAHVGSLDEGHQTYAILGSGLEIVYPIENSTLFHKIAQTGAVISEFPLQTPPEAHHFPIRNRIISGMSLGVVVVEASQKSGSLITARLAAEQNREVFAVPGSIQSFKSAGTHGLIKQGAKLVETTQDILDEIRFNQPVESEQKHIYHHRVDTHTADHSEEEKKVLSCIGHYPIHINDISKQLGLNTGKLAAILLKLELSGAIEKLPGDNFVLTH